MSIWGKIIGGATGLMFGGPLGALLGVAGGHYWDKSQNNNASTDNQQRQLVFSITVIALSAKMAKADGRVTKDEIRIFKQMFQYSDAEQETVANIYREAQKTSDGFRDYAQQSVEILGSGAQVLEELVWALAEIAKADNHLHENEIQFLREVSAIFGLSPAVFARINALEVQGNAADAYTILGIEREASNDAIKKHYRTLVRELHPDRLIAEGLPEEAIEVSGKKLAAINAAYDRISAERGIR